MLRSVAGDPIQYFLIIVEPIGDFFEFVAIQFEEGEQMFVETNGFVVVTVEQSLAVQTSLIDQARQMHISAELLVRTARSQLLHSADLGRGKRSEEHTSEL